MSAWDNLSIREKAAMMRTAVSNGITNIDDIRREYNEFAEGGPKQNFFTEVPNSTFVSKPLPLEILTNSNSPEAALKRTNRVYSNYSEAKDNPLTPLQEVSRNTLRWFQDRGLNPFGSGVSNCTLAATQWVDPNNPIKNASSIYNSPELYNYTQIDEKDAIPGDIVIAKDPNKESYHTMLINGFAKGDGVYNFDGNNFSYKKGEPLMTYSRGGHDASFIRRDVPLSVYTANGDGHTSNTFYRYNYPNTVTLPEVIVTPKALGGNLFADGGIHIKPSHRGRLTELKARTGKTEAELYNDGNPAHKKMVVFARNARKWHGLGGNLYPDGGVTYDGGILPELQVTGYAPIRLITYYPVISKFPYTGHSELEIPIDTTTWNTYKEDSRYREKISPYLTINKGGSSRDYNLLTNNCADATLSYLNSAFNTEENPILFTTPGDVRDYAINTLGGKVIEGTEKGSDIVLIPRDVNNYEQLSKDAVLWHNTHDPHSSGFSFKGPLKYNKRHSLGGNLYAPGGPAKTLNPSVLRAMKYFMNKGLTDYQAAGLVGNLMRESSLDHRAENKSSKAYGLAQWLGDRKTNLFNKYGNNPTFEQQLDYVWDELNSTHKNGLKMLKASKSAEEAARNAMGYYEFSAGPEKAIANMIKHGQDGEGSMRKGVNFAMGIMGQTPAEYVPQMQLPPNYNVLQNWELPTPQYTLDELAASGTMMPAKELPLTTRIPSSVERPNALLDLLAQYQYLDSLLSQ